MKYAIIEDGVVVNIARADVAQGDNWRRINNADDVTIGDTFDGSSFSRPEQEQEVPAAVTRRQAKQALLLADKLDAAQAAIEAIEDDTERALAMIYWTEAADFERNHPLIADIGAALDLDEDEIDDLFVTAGSLP